MWETRVFDFYTTLHGREYPFTFPDIEYEEWRIDYMLFINYK